MKHLLTLLAMVSATSFAADLPDRSITPGAINLDITQGNIQQTVCVKGFTKTIRPPVSYTNKLKKAQSRTMATPTPTPRTMKKTT